MVSVHLTLKEKAIGASIIVLILFFGAAYYFIILPKMNETKRIRAEVLVLNNQIQNTRKVIQGYRAKQAAVEKQSSFFQEKFLTHSDQIPQILSILGDVVRKSNIDIISVRPGKLQNSQWQNFEYQSLDIALLLKGKYLAFWDCLKSFLDIPFLVDVTNVQFRKDEKGNVNMKLILKTFFLPGE
ncbi:type 4a pilus biogenesis protein PilO [Candidatus Margulisiibacteriota bacterium]